MNLEVLADYSFLMGQGGGFGGFSSSRALDL